MAEEERHSLLHAEPRRGHHGVGAPRSARPAQMWLLLAAALAAGVVIGRGMPRDSAWLSFPRASAARPTHSPPPAPLLRPPHPSPHPPPPPQRAVPHIPLLPWRHILNESLGWAELTVPRFLCADADVTTTYWYRWRLFHLHMRRGPKAAHCPADGCWVLTEFLRQIFWSGPHNTIVAPAGHHIMEGRWIYDKTVIDDYARFWFGGGGFRKQYTFWGAYALWQRSLVLDESPAQGVSARLFDALVENYHDWIRTHFDPREQCMFQSCHADGQENSAGLDGCRPTINSVMFGEAAALAALATALRNASQRQFFEEEQRRWQRVLTSRLWSREKRFFMNLATPPPKALHREIREFNRLRRAREVQTYFGCLACERGRTCPPERGYPNGQLVPPRELMGLSSPWYFSAVPRDPERSRTYARAFEQLHHPDGFGAKWGPRTTERRACAYNFSNRAQCNWNGPVWPFETSKAGTALINLLQLYPEQPHAGRGDFDRLLRTYARAHTRSHAEGLLPPHVDEDLHPDDGYWITRRKLHGVHPWPNTGGLGSPKDRLRNRGDHYFHSSFNDLVLSGLVGLRPRDQYLEIYPLTLISWFCATGVRVRGLNLSIVWDEEGTHFSLGAGLHVWVDSNYVGTSPPLSRHEGTGAPRVRLGWAETSGRRRFVTCPTAAYSQAQAHWWDC